MELTRLQTESVLKQFLEKENGLNEVLEMILNSLMLIFMKSIPLLFTKSIPLKINK